MLRACFAAFGERTADDPLRMEFEQLRRLAGGEPLRRFALFSAIAAEHPRVPWQAWPDALREPDSARNARLRAPACASHPDFALYLQWLADRQFDAAARAARASGLAFGFFRDLAVGAAPDGAEVWANPSSFARGVAIGAPPDPFARDGQNWNLPPPNPHALRASGCAAFGELLAANMRHAGALRIDHVMGLTRLYWIPDGAAAVDGAYVRYPLEALLRVLAAESVRARCLVVGEDLGTVPEGLRERLAASRRVVLSRAVVRARGIVVRRAGALPAAGARLGLDARPADDRRMVERRRHRRESLARPSRCERRRGSEDRARTGKALARAMRSTRQACAEAPRSRQRLRTTPRSRPPFTATSGPRLRRSSFCRRTTSPARRAALNLPGTDRERPNWRRKVRVGVDGLWQTPGAVLAIAGLAARDGRSVRDAPQ